MVQLFETSNRHLALISGISLFLMALVAALGYGYFFDRISFVHYENDSVADMSNYSLYLRLVIISFITILILDVVVAWAFYYYFKDANEPLSLLAALLRIMTAAILGTSLMSLSEMIHIVPDELFQKNLIAVKLKTFLSVWSLSLIPFAFHLLLISMVAMRAALFPEMICIITFFSGLCYLIIHVLTIAWPGYLQYSEVVNKIFALPMALGELLLAYVLIKKAVTTKRKM